MAIVWPCALSVDDYLAAGHDVEVPRPLCPSCSGSMTFWSGYTRSLRAGDRCVSMWVPRARCGACGATHALLPAFVVVGRLDTVETIGAVLDGVVCGPDGVRPVAEHLDVPHTTARGWLRRFGDRAEQLAIAFAALAVDLGGEILRPVHDIARYPVPSLPSPCLRELCG